MDYKMPLCDAIQRFSEVPKINTRWDARDHHAAKALLDAIAAKDAEIERLEKHIDKLNDSRCLICSYCGHTEWWKDRERVAVVTAMRDHEQTCARNPVVQKAESLQSKCAKIREILVARDEEARSAFEFFRLNLPACDGECAPEGSCITERCLRCYAKYCAKHRGRNRIDAILESEEA